MKPQVLKWILREDNRNRDFLTQGNSRDTYYTSAKNRPHNFRLCFSFLISKMGIIKEYLVEGLKGGLNEIIHVKCSWEYLEHY